jgi:hypothetical protein
MDKREYIGIRISDKYGNESCVPIFHWCFVGGKYKKLGLVNGVEDILLVKEEVISYDEFVRRIQDLNWRFSDEADD